MTEYKLAYKDPTTSLRKGHNTVTVVTKKRKNANSKPSPSSSAPSVPHFAVVAPPSSSSKGVALPAIGGGSFTAPAKNGGVSKKDLWQPPPMPGDCESTSLTLPGMLSNHHVPSVHFRRRRILGGGGLAKSGYAHAARYDIISGNVSQSDYVHGIDFSN
jgi:hypothetical protein